MNVAFENYSHFIKELSHGTEEALGFISTNQVITYDRNVRCENIVEG